MTQKLFCLCAVCALLFVFATANVASAEEVGAPAGCPCDYVAAPCKFVTPACPPVAFRVGLFGVVRPVVYAPVYRPVYYPPRYVYPRYAPYRAYPPFYAW